jgi:hypothetical protein
MVPELQKGQSAHGKISYSYPRNVSKKSPSVMQPYGFEDIITRSIVGVVYNFGIDVRTLAGWSCP